ncbi:MAG: glycosyltransferase family 4 protein [Polyangiaceae bacterium]|nr:glycosyltransferase family 4 protein [Polyangiaceae bacterium]
MTMRILIPTSTFPLELSGGWRRFVYDLAAALAKKAEVTVLAPGAPGASDRERMGPVDVRRFSYFWPKSRQCLAYGTSMVDSMRESGWAKAQVPTFLMAQAHAIRRLVATEHFDVVNSHWMVPQGLSVAAASFLTRPFKHVLSIHAGDVYLLNKVPQGRNLAKFIMSRTDAVFADGSHVRDTLDKLTGTPSNGILQPMGAHVELFRNALPMQSPFPQGYLLFFGRFAEKKGITYLLQALPKVLKEWPGLGLILIGYGTLESALKAEAEALGLAGAVEFVGAKDHSEICRYLHGCRLAVVPSIIDSRGETEGMPTVVIEAMAAGVPVVGSNVDGIPDVISDRVNGWLCREKDPADLAAKILVALSNPDAEAFRKNALETAQHHDWDQVADRYLEVFERLLR